jgi:hypothetical protein
MAQCVFAKLADQTSASATQLVIALPATSILPSSGTGTTGVSLAGLDGLLIFTITSAAVALTQGLTLLGADAASSPTVPLVIFSAPAAGVQNMSYHYGPGMGMASGTSQYAGADGFMTDKITFQATPGAASTVRIVVYGIRRLG